MKIVLLNVEQAQSIYRSQMVRDFPESELKPFASVQGMMTRGLYEPLAFYDEAGALMAYAWQAVLPQCRNVLLDYFAVLPQYRGSGVGTAVLKELAAYYAPRKQSLIIECEHPAEAPEGHRHGPDEGHEEGPHSQQHPVRGPHFRSRALRRRSRSLICSSTTGIRRAKLLCSRTSRVSSSSLVSVTAWERLLAISTPSSVTAPEISATTMASIPRILSLHRIFPPSRPPRAICRGKAPISGEAAAKRCTVPCKGRGIFFAAASRRTQIPPSPAAAPLL